MDPRNTEHGHGTPITRTTKLNEHDGTWNKRTHKNATQRQHREACISGAKLVVDHLPVVSLIDHHFNFDSSLHH